MMATSLCCNTHSEGGGRGLTINLTRVCWVNSLCLITLEALLSKIFVSPEVLMR